MLTEEQTTEGLAESTTAAEEPESSSTGQEAEGAASEGEEQATEGQAPGEDEGEDTAETVDDEAAKRERETFYWKRRAAKEKREREEFQARIEQQLEELRGQGAKPRIPENKPKLDDFETLDEFMDARDAWARSQWESEQEQQRSQQEQQQAMQVEVEAWQKFAGVEREYKATLPDKGVEYDQLTNDLNQTLLDELGDSVLAHPLSKALRVAGPRVIHAVARDVRLLDRLLQSDALTIGLELGKIAAKAQDGGRLGRKFSKTPGPPPKVETGVTRNPSPSLEDALRDDEAYERLRKELGITG